MKIIGEDKTTSDKRFIVSVSEDDLAKFVGFYSAYSCREKIKLEPGVTLKVGECYEDAKKALDLSRDATSAAKSLQKAASVFLGFFVGEKD